MNPCSHERRSALAVLPRPKDATKAPTLDASRGDSGWRDLTAMCYHYETQPVPNPVSWYEIPTTLPTEHSPFL